MIMKHGPNRESGMWHGLIIKNRNGDPGFCNPDSLDSGLHNCEVQGFYMGLGGLGSLLQFEALIDLQSEIWKPVCVNARFSAFALRIPGHCKTIQNLNLRPIYVSPIYGCRIGAPISLPSTGVGVGHWFRSGFGQWLSSSTSFSKGQTQVFKGGYGLSDTCKVHVFVCSEQKVRKSAVPVPLYAPAYDKSCPPNVPPPPPPEALEMKSRKPPRILFLRFRRLLVVTH